MLELYQNCTNFYTFFLFWELDNPSFHHIPVKNISQIQLQRQASGQ